MEVPEPTLCPDCRMQRRMAVRNERNLYKRICDLTGKSIISCYSPEKPFTVYHHKEWMSDKWDPLSYGRDFDFSRSFFEQYAELQKDMPRISLHVNDTMENCDYCNYGGTSKDCYLTFCPVQSEKCLYSWTPGMCLEDIDGYANISCQHVYECSTVEYSYELFYSSFCQNCSNSYFLLDCKDCQYCFGCTNLQHKKYYFFNEPLSKENFEKKVAEITSSSSHLQKFAQEFSQFFLRFPRKCVRNTQVENCEGDLLRHSKNCKECFDTFDFQDCRYCFLGGLKSHHIYDSFVIGIGAAECYEHVGSLGCNHSAFAIFARGLSDSYYTDSCTNSQNIFGCIGLRYKKNCILNKQYTKEEYEKILPEIIDHMKTTGEWGEFFPVEISLFAYNETMAQEFFPMTKEEALKKGWKWRDEEQTELLGTTKKIFASKLPDKIEDVSDDILNWSIECEESGKLFRIQKTELEFYRKMKIPLPHFHPDVRYIKRLQRKNPPKLWNRNCAKCQKEIQTSYSPERPEIVYCEACYLKEIY